MSTLLGVGVIIIVVMIRKRRITTKPSSAVSYQETANYTRHASEIKTDTNEAYHSISNNVIASTNPAYNTVTMSEAQSNALDNGSSIDAEYERVSTNIAPTSVSAVVTSPNVAYNKGTDITTPAYIPTQDSSENTLEYDYI